MSEQAYNDQTKQDKVSAKGELFLAQPGAQFNIETTALSVEARVEEVSYGVGGTFNSVKVSLSAYLKEGAEIGGDMPVPEGFS